METSSRILQRHRNSWNSGLQRFKTTNALSVRYGLKLIFLVKPISVYIVTIQIVNHLQLAEQCQIKGIKNLINKNVIDLYSSSIYLEQSLPHVLIDFPLTTKTDIRFACCHSSFYFEDSRWIINTWNRHPCKWNWFRLVSSCWSVHARVFRGYTGTASISRSRSNAFKLGSLVSKAKSPRLVRGLK